MATSSWPNKQLSVASLHLDPKNPRLGGALESSAPREVIQYLFDNEKAYDLAHSIAARGYFPTEPLLVVKENGNFIVIEGNRRLAALKALNNPELLEGNFQRKVERLARRNSGSITNKVPVVVAPTRRSADRLVAGRHIGTPVTAWSKENRAYFILDKLANGYTGDDIKDELGFSDTDIQGARQTQAISNIIKGLDLPDDIKTIVEKPRNKLFTTVERVVDSTAGKKFLHLKKDFEHGIIGSTTAKEVERGFTKLVTDLASRKISSRSLNTNEDINSYFDSWASDELPKKKRGKFIPEDTANTGAKVPPTRPSVTSRRVKIPTRKSSTTVLPKNLRISYGNDRMKDLHKEMSRLDREKFPNSGAVLMRVFFELSALHYLERSGELQKVKSELEKKGKLSRHGSPTLHQLAKSIINIAKAQLSRHEASMVEKAVTPNASAPFSISELHSFIHSPDFPVARDIEQFWVRTEALFRVFLEKDLPQ